MHIYFCLFLERKIKILFKFLLYKGRPSLWSTEIDLKLQDKTYFTVNHTWLISSQHSQFLVFRVVFLNLVKTKQQQEIKVNYVSKYQ